MLIAEEKTIYGILWITPVIKHTWKLTGTRNMINEEAKGYNAINFLNK